MGLSDLLLLLGQPAVLALFLGPKHVLRQGLLRGEARAGLLLLLLLLHLNRHLRNHMWWVLIPACHQDCRGE